MDATYTNSALTTHRRCGREFQIRYERQLERVGDDREVLQVGSTWHKAHEARDKGGNPYDAISRHAPSALWAEKLSRLFAAYLWYWEDQPLDVERPEFTFGVEIESGVTGDPIPFLGQIDGVIRISGRRGILERKTTSEDLSADSRYWDRLRMDTQVGAYSLAFRKEFGEMPAFVIYDVVRKPTIRAKSLTKADVARMKEENDEHGFAGYFGEKFQGAELEEALATKRESLGMYGARLTADIGDRPDWYFARREVQRTQQDLEAAATDIGHHVAQIEFDRGHGGFARNPDACNTFGLCDFFDLCANNADISTGKVPDGFQVREHRHPELHDDDEEVPF